MATPFKVKLRRVVKESFCWHKEYTRIKRMCGYASFIECKCLECGKVWVED